MAFPFWTADILFNVNNIILIGWLALIFAPFHKLSKYFVLAPNLILSIIYTVILFQIAFFPKPNSPPLDFFHLSGWLLLVKDPFMIVGITNHFCMMDIWAGQWMVNDFYSSYTFAYSVTMDTNGTYQVKKSLTIGRIIFTLILLLTYMVAPFGFLVYHLAKFTFLQKYKANNPIDFQNYQSFSVKSNLNQLQTESLNRRPVRFGDKLPTPLQKIYHVILGIVGLIVLFTIALPTYFILLIYCRIKYHSPATPSTTNSSLTPSKLIPEFVRNETAKMKLKSLTTPLEKRNWIWHLKFLLLQISTFIEYIPNKDNPIALFGSLNDYFQRMYHVRYFVFGDGIAVNSYDLVKRYLQDLHPQKGFESLGWQVSSSQGTFCDFTTIFVSSNDPQMELGRKIVFAWLHAFPYKLPNTDVEARCNLSRLVPRQIDQQPNETAVYQAVGEVMFFLATGGELRKNEREAFIDCVNNPLIFFPNWFNFLLAGHYLERKTLNSYYILLEAFSRYSGGQAIRAAVTAAGTEKSELEVLKLIAIVFSIAGSAAPAKLAFTVIERLWSNKKINVPLFKKNPQNFIKECARLDKVVPMVNVLATNEIANEIEDDFRNNNHSIKIPKNTPIHCSLVNANRDETIFQNPNEFLPERPDLNKIIVWNGVEEDIINSDKNKRPIRYCPGHHLSLAAIQYVAEQFLPVIYNDDENLISEKLDSSLKSDSDLKKSEGQNDLTKFSNETEEKLISMNFSIKRPLEKDPSCYNVLDWYTIFVMGLMNVAVKDSNSSPSRGSDILQPFSTPAKDLDIIRLSMAKFIPTWDEDDPKGAGYLRRLARWLVNKDIWDFYDCLTEFNTVEQAIQWRMKMFPALPVPNTVYKNLSTDEAMTQLAFAGCACHYTNRIGKSRHPVSDIPDQKFLEDAVYVNDMTGLSTFRVRTPFERYGAAAYFNANYEIIGIYWSHRRQLVKPNEQFWEHAKYVWRSTFFAYITIRDHLVAAHMIEGNAFVTASRKCLSANHALRKFLKPFTYHTVSVNYQAAMSLINERGLVHRIWAFDYDEFLKVCDYISMNYKFRLLPDFIHESMRPKKDDKEAKDDKQTDDEKKAEADKPTKEEWDKIYPIYHDVTEFWNIIQNYVRRFFEINYVSLDNDNLPNDFQMRRFINEICKQLGIPGITSLPRFIDVLSQLIATGTGFHEHVGQVSDYLIDPRFVGAKLQEGKEIQNIQTYSQILVLAVVTGFRMPGLLEDWSHLIEYDEKHEKNLDNYQNFKNELQKLSKDIDRRNKKTRRYPFQSFNPKYMECSISV